MPIGTVVNSFYCFTQQCPKMSFIPMTLLLVLHSTDRNIHNSENFRSHMMSQLKVNALYIAFLAYFLAFLKERQAYDSVIACCLFLQNFV